MIVVGYILVAVSINVMGDILAIEVEKDNNGNSGTNREDDPQKFTT